MPKTLLFARFEMLPDGKRGQILYADRTKSAPFATHVVAGEILNQALIMGKITKIDAAYVGKHVLRSIKVVRDAERDRWCDETSDREEEERETAKFATRGLGTPQASMAS